MWSRISAPLILNLHTRWRLIVNSRSGHCTRGKEHFCPLKWRMDGRQILSGWLKQRNVSVPEFQICHFQSVTLTLRWLRYVIFVSNFKVEFMDFSGRCVHQIKSSQHYSEQSFSRVQNILFWGKLNNLETGKLSRGFHAFRSSVFQMIVFCVKSRLGMLVQTLRRKGLPSNSGRLN